MLYWQIFKFKFLRFLAYPWEIFASVSKRFIEIIFLVFFWSLIIRNSSIQIELEEIASYFLIASGVGDLVMARWGGLGSDIGRKIKYGEISKTMIKPVDIIPTLYAMAMGSMGMRTILAFVFIIVGLIINPPLSWLAVLLFFVFFVNAFIISFAYNVMIGSLFFHLGDASGIKNSITHMTRVLSGALIPIHFFPDHIERIIKLTPFPMMIYGPVNALVTNSISLQVIQDIGVGLAWSVLFGLASYFFWGYSIKRYEAVGI